MTFERMCPKWNVNVQEKTYNDEFKKTSVDLYHAGNSIEDLSNECGVSEGTIYKWAKPFTPIS
ncbi:transposase [Priestia megaterium]|uniref:transposase n=1 Tax=Priestia megaterium TaxID=1404 RepID=UPI002730B661|nr:helix-turn-helix domain-containing protein [Priestia megaterium]MDP1442091.1 helix-turn-helix domain-containing protein [Priestia megaterium]MDP1471132.1 helix-turn-helix domain-containing protein [Priestia megaterium]